MSDLLTTVLAGLVALLGVTLIIVIIITTSALVNGYVLSILWGWFVVPTFGLAPLSIPAAIGLAMVVHYLTYNYNDAKDPDCKWWIPVTVTVVRSVIALILGFIVHRFI